MDEDWKFKDPPNLPSGNARPLRVNEARKFGHAFMIIDGEAVVLDDHGR
ncbi:hypothetical protein [Ensifer sp. 4252]